MTGSNTTKKAFAKALKELMNEKQFEKISISDICDMCNRNRKSFYYHFKDKYDLVNWIFDTEFIAIAESKNYEDSWEFFVDISKFFEENRTFYRKALCIQGQNSFSNHFRELVLQAITKRLQAAYGKEGNGEFQINFFADALVMTFQRWILEYDGMQPAEFVEQLKICCRYMAIKYDGTEAEGMKG